MMNFVIESFNEINKTSFITDIPNMVRSMDPSYNLEMGIYSGPDSPICASHRFKAGMIHAVFYSVVENITFFGGF